MLSLSIALIVFIAAGFGGRWLLPRLARTRDPRQAGLAYLGLLRWRDFTRLVVQAMKARGYALVQDPRGPADGVPTDGADILLQRDGQLTLLSCKYGSGSVVGTQAIMGLGKAAELRGADAAIVVSPGRFDDEARRLAGRQQVELIDGAQLWPEVEAFVDPAQLPNDPQVGAAIGHPGLPWLAALVLAAIAWMLVPRGGTDASRTDIDPSIPAPITADDAARQPAPERATREVTIPEAAATPTTLPAVEGPGARERRRKEAADAISTLPGVDRAIWSTQSTLVVYLATADADPLGSLCPLLVRYEELAPSRLQLQPPAGSDKPVRFRQCRSY